MTKIDEKIPPGYKKTKVGVIPEEWDVLLFKDIAPLQRGFDLTNSQLEKGSVPVVYSNGIRNFHSIYKVKGPGVVTGRSGTIGKVTYVKENFWPHNTSLWVTNFHKNNPRFIYYFLLSLKLENYLSGSGVPTLNRNDIHSLKVGLPPLAEQGKIAEVLSKWDEGVEKSEKLIELKEKRKKALMQQLLTGKKRFPRFVQDSKVKSSNGEIPTTKSEVQDAKCDVRDTKFGNDYPTDWELTKIGELLVESRIAGTDGLRARKITVKLYGKGVFEKDEKTKGSANTKYFIRKKGQFIYSKLDFLNGAFGIVPDELNDFETTLDLPCFDFTSKVVPNFLLAYVSRE